MQHRFIKLSPRAVCLRHDQGAIEPEPRAEPGNPAPKPLGDVLVRSLEPTELLALKVVAAQDRRGSEKGSKDLADLLALLSS